MWHCLEPLRCWYALWFFISSVYQFSKYLYDLSTKPGTIVSWNVIWEILFQYVVQLLTCCFTIHFMINRAQGTVQAVRVAWLYLRIWYSISIQSSLFITSAQTQTKSESPEAKKNKTGETNFWFLLSSLFLIARINIMFCSLLISNMQCSFGKNTECEMNSCFSCN